MGLIKAGVGALGGTFADQWKEFFYCEALDKDVLVTKGTKRITSRSSNTKGNDNIISNGSGIAVADGQCMIIVEQGKVVEVCAEPGEFTYDSSTEPSIFAGSLGQSILDTFKTVGKRFAYGGDTGKDQRVYYFNTKEIMDNTVVSHSGLTQMAEAIYMLLRGSFLNHKAVRSYRTREVMIYDRGKAKVSLDGTEWRDAGDVFKITIQQEWINFIIP